MHVRISRSAVRRAWPALVPLLVNPVCFPLLAADEAPCIQWLMYEEGQTKTTCSGLAVDRKGNSYLVGYLTWPTNAASGISPATGSNLLFLAKFDQDGDFLWAHPIPHEGRFLLCDRVAVDPDDNPFLLSKTSTNEIMLAKLDPFGRPIWRQVFHGMRGYPVANSLAAASDGTVYFCGSFSGQAEFGPHSLQQTNGPVRGQFDIGGFVARVARNGHVLWARKVDTPAYATLRSIAVDSTGNCFVTGTIGAGYDQPAYTSHAKFSCFFLAKYDRTGSLLWARTADDGSDFSNGRSVAVDSAGNACVCGQFAGIDFALNGVGLSFPRFGLGSSPSFLARYDAAGNPLWVRTVGTPPAGICLATSSPSNTRIYVLGELRQKDRLAGNDLQKTPTAPPAGERSWLLEPQFKFFVAEYDANGNQDWVATSPSPDPVCTNFVFNFSSTLSPRGEIFFTGSLAQRYCYDVTNIAHMYVAKVVPAELRGKLPALETPKSARLIKARNLLAALSSEITVHTAAALGTNSPVDRNFAPNLEISAPRGQVILSWPSSAQGWQLEGCDVLAKAIQWEALSNTPVLANERFVVVHEPKQGRWFYRLRRP
jgi:outer membrane protein assembly factor BamB